MALVKITYEDGTVQEATERPAHLVAVERKWPDREDRRNHAYEVLHFGFWQAAGAPDTFDAWLAKVVSIETVEASEPDPPAQPTGTSQT